MTNPQGTQTITKLIKGRYDTIVEFLNEFKSQTMKKMEIIRNKQAQQAKDLTFKIETNFETRLQTVFKELEAARIQSKKALEEDLKELKINLN